VSRGRGVSAVVALVSAILRLYPSRFRQRFGNEIRDSVRADLRESLELGRRAFVAASARELVQAAGGVVPQHRLERARRRRLTFKESLMHTFRSALADVRFAVRSLSQSPAFTVVAVGVLALAIGAGTAIFSVVDAVVLRGLPFDGHDRLAAVLEQDIKRPQTFGGGRTTLQTFLDWRERQHSFERLALVGGTRFWVPSATGQPMEIRGQRVSHEFFETLRVPPLLGRGFSIEEESHGRRVVVLSYGFWQQRFEGAEDIVGRTIELNDVPDAPWEVVGVMPPGFAWPVAADQPTAVYIPPEIQESDRTRVNAGRNYNWLAIGRLEPGVSFAQAQEEMSRIMAALEAEHPTWMADQGARVVPLHRHIAGDVRGWMLLLLGAVGLVLLIACANVANLMLARYTVKAREMGIRAALGAGRWRLVRGLLIEGLVLSLAGAALGVFAAQGGVALLRAWLPPELPRLASVGIDLRVLAAAAGAAVMTGMVFGLLPALQSSRPDIARALGDGGRSMTGARGGRLRSALVVAEVALAVLLLVGAGLFTGSFIQLLRIDPGFDYRNLIAIDVGVRADPAALAAAGTPAERQQVLAAARSRGGAFFETIKAAIGRVPGVAGVEQVNGGVPLTGSWGRVGVTLPGRGALTGDGDDIDLRSVSPGYLELLGVPLREGRYLREEDNRPGSEQVLVINEAAARKYWPGERALGQRITVSGDDRIVVGIVGSIRHLGPESPARQEAYRPIGSPSSATLMIRTTRDARDVLPGVKSAIWSVDPRQRLSGDAFTLEGYMDRLIAQRRFSMALLALLGALGLVIAAAGVYGVMAYAVSQRTQEIGVRIALGARPSDVMSMILRQAALLVGLGLALGTAVAWYASTAAQAFLFRMASNDVRVFAAAVTVLAASGLVACVLPARRAARVDPLIALRGA
jgi:putative ABC transport system permease protein